jgi:hypothetical protein
MGHLRVFDLRGDAIVEGDKSWTKSKRPPDRREIYPIGTEGAENFQVEKDDEYSVQRMRRGASRFRTSASGEQGPFLIWTQILGAKTSTCWRLQISLLIVAC